MGDENRSESSSGSTNSENSLKPLKKRSEPDDFTRMDLEKMLKRELEEDSASEEDDTL